MIGLSLSAGIAAAMLFLIALARPWPVPAQPATPAQPPAPAQPSGPTEPAPPTQPSPAQPPAPEVSTPSQPPGYVGAETCKGCHEEAFRRFETDRKSTRLNSSHL